MLRTEVATSPPENRTGGGTDAPEEQTPGRRAITAAVVEEADGLLAQGVEYATVATRLGITEYVVRVMAGDRLRSGRRQPRQRHKRHAVNPRRGVDAATIRRVQRMLAVGILSHREVAREAGVSEHLVGQVAAGQRLILSTERPAVFKDLEERFLPKPIRCSGCRAMISIVPCRACRALREKRSFGFSTPAAGAVLSAESAQQVFEAGSQD